MCLEHERRTRADQGQMCQYRTAVVERALTACGVKFKALSQDKSGRVFAEDAHKGGGITSARRRLKSKEPLYIHPDDQPALNALLATQEELWAADYILPTTLDGFGTKSDAE